MVKTYTVNLDLQPKLRWLEILNDNKDKFARLKIEINKILVNLGYNSSIAMFVKTSIYTFSSKILYYNELISISEITEISIDKILIMQLMYELSAACTSIVTKIDGKNVMLRTMDWDMSFLKDITINVNFKSKDKILFTATTWIGYVGILTGLSIGNQWSLAINYRRTKDITFTSLINNLMSTLSMNWPIGYLVRKILEFNMSIDETIITLKGAKLISPSYITVCHQNKSCIIVRDADKCVKILDGLPLVQTNVDFNKIEPNIIYSNERRSLCNKILQNKDLTLDSLISNLKIFPIFNEETIYFSVIIPETNYYLTSV